MRNSLLEPDRSGIPIDFGFAVIFPRIASFVYYSVLCHCRYIIDVIVSSIRHYKIDFAVRRRWARVCARARADVPLRRQRSAAPRGSEREEEKSQFTNSFPTFYLSPCDRGAHICSASFWASALRS